MKLFILFLLVFITSNVLGQPLPAESQYQVGKNLLTNGGFEQGKKGWTSSAGTFSVTSANGAVDGVAGCVTLSAQTLSLTNLSTANVANLKGDATVSAEVYSTVAGVQACSVVDNVEIDCVNIGNLSSWANSVNINTVFGSTNYGVRLKTSGNVTGTVCLDEARVLKQSFVTVSQPHLIGVAQIQGTTGCQWQRTNTAPGAFGAVAACPGPTSIISGNYGAVQTTDTDLPRFTWNNLPVGKYVVSMEVPTNNGAAAVSALAISDGVTTSKPRIATEDNGITQGVTLSATFEYSSPGSRTWELFGAQSSGTLRINNNTTSPDNGLRVTVTYYPPDTAIVSQRCTNNPTQCENVFSAKATSGAVVSNENLDFINGNGSIPTTGRFQYTFNTGIFTAAPNCVVVNDSENTVNGTNTFTCSVISTSSTTLDIQCKQIATITNRPHQIICQKSPPDYKAEQLITGTFAEMVKTPGVPKPVTRSAKINCDASSAITSQRGTAWITSVGNASGGQCLITLPATSFLDTPECSLTNTAAVTGDATTFTLSLVHTSATSLSSDCRISAGATSDCTAYDYTLICHGAAP
jgi:hypothetical protein